MTGSAVASPYGLWLGEELARAATDGPRVPDLPLWDPERALAELAPGDPEAAIDPALQLAAWALAHSLAKPATAHGHLVRAARSDALEPSQLSWARAHVPGPDLRDALLDAWNVATAPHTRAHLAAAIALTTWDASCPVAPSPERACLDPARGVPLLRDPVAIEQAKRWTARARELRSKHLGDEPGSAGARLAWELEFAASAVDYEALVVARMPDDLEFTVEDWRHGSGDPEWEAIHARQLEVAERSRRVAGAFIDSFASCSRSVSELHAEATTVEVEVAGVALLREAGLLLALQRALLEPSLRSERSWARERAEHGGWSFTHPPDPVYLELAADSLRLCVDRGPGLGFSSVILDACWARLDEIGWFELGGGAELVPEPGDHSRMQRYGVQP